MGRVRTAEDHRSGDKKVTVAVLLAKAIPDSDMHERINKETAELTEIGNTFMIRHTEVGKKPITKSEQVDYFFQRMFAVVRLLLKATGRGG